MTPRAEAILAGPRGRRLCLELVRDADPEIDRVVHHLERGSRPFSPEALERLAAALADLGRPTPDSPAPGRPTLDGPRILAAMGKAVDAAAYWQPPDGADLLAAHPAVRAGLSGVADEIASDPSTAWFDRPCRLEQWAIDWQSENASPPLPKDARATLAKWALHDGSEVGLGAWWSIPLGLAQTVDRLPAALGLVEDSFGWERATTIPVRGAGRVFEIAAAEDWTALCREYPRDVTVTRRGEWLPATGRNRRWVIPDWERVAREWDAVHLQPLAYLGSAGRVLEIEAGAGTTATATVLAGFDPGSTLWLTDVVVEWEGPRQDWSFDGGDGTWTQV